MSWDVFTIQTSWKEHCELLTTGEGRAHASTAPASGGLATGGDSTLGLQASRAAKCLEEEAALGPKYR